MPGQQRNHARFADSRNEPLDLAWINFVRSLSHQAQQYAAVRAVAEPGKGKRSEKLDAGLGDLVEQLVIGKSFGETIRGTHGAHGVGTRGPDADLEQVKKTGVHERSPPFRGEARDHRVRYHKFEFSVP